ncbi:MAG: purine-binding chemotaxis protein CheW [Candidatus Hydrogenedentes bacterium]|nr:purine-binding chemotaxis protein CheW [Candidatus Hydrogenedentota bacterium]
MTNAVADAPVAAGGHVAAHDRAGQYLTFCLGPEVYGIEILKVREIIGMMPVTKVPRTPNFVRGVVNLRGKVVPVIELRAKFEMERIDDTGMTCIIVVQVSGAAQKITMGIIVDAVAEVVAITGDQIEPAPQFGSGIRTEFILGIGKVASKVVILLDIDKVLSWGELANLDEAAHA